MSYQVDEAKCILSFVSSLRSVVAGFEDRVRFDTALVIAYWKQPCRSNDGAMKGREAQTRYGMSTTCHS